MSKSRIGNDPLDALFSQPETRDPQPEKEERAQSPTHSLPKARKARVTFLLDEEVADKARDLVFWSPGETMASFAERAIKKAIAAEEKKRGEPFPPRKADLPKGRPVS